jgi:hypothetical protein
MQNIAPLDIDQCRALDEDSSSTVLHWLILHSFQRFLIEEPLITVQFKGLYQLAF